MDTLSHNHRGETLNQWLAQVDRHVGAIAGLTHSDLADQPWYDWWADDVEPREAAIMLLEDEGFPMELLS